MRRPHRVLPRPAARAERRPTTSIRHGVTLTDDYAWLRAENWREVMRDPSVLDPAIRAYLEAENAYEKAALAHTQPLQETAVRRDEGAHQGGRLIGASPDGAYAYYSPLPRRRAASDRLPPAARRRRGAKRCSTATRSRPARPTSSSAAMRHSPDHRLLAWSADDKGSEFDELRVRDLATGRRILPT